MGSFDAGSFYSGAFDEGFVAPTVPIPTVGVTVPDHVAAALGRLLEQFKNKPNIAALLSALAAPSQPIENALWQLLTQRALSTGIGAQLDAIGALVGQPRNGLVDADYARYIGARIAVNDSDGRVEDLITISRGVLNNAAAVIRVQPEGTATVIVRIHAIAVTLALGTILSGLLDAGVAGGVRLLLEASASVPANTFTFDSGPGWDTGHLAYAID